MKRIIQLLLILTSFGINACGQGTVGTKIIAPVVPNDSLDDYATHDAYFGRGGYRVVKSIVLRDAIKQSRRTEGMLVEVTDENIFYTLAGGIDNTKWVVWMDMKKLPQWDLAYSWGDHSKAGYLKTENDPIFTIHPASTVTANGILNWNTAYSWGNHASAGYLKTESDPVFKAHPAFGVTTSFISNWNTAFTWGNHALAGYLKAESDPIFSAHPASNVTTGLLSNWNTAFSWGNHASQGYLKTESDPIFLAHPAHNIINNGDGTKYLANDGTYKTVASAGVTPVSNIFKWNATGKDYEPYAKTEAGQGKFYAMGNGWVNPLPTTDDGSTLNYWGTLNAANFAVLNNNVVVGDITKKPWINASTATSNVVIGISAAEKLTTGGVWNTIVGNVTAGNLTTGNTNVFVGGNVGNGIITGFGNVMVGYSNEFTDTKNPDGNQNVYLGFSTATNVAGSKNVFIGPWVGRGWQGQTKNNTLAIDNQATTTPLIYGEFDNRKVQINGSLNSTGGFINNGTAGISMSMNYNEIDQTGKNYRNVTIVISGGLITGVTQGSWTKI